MKDVKFFLVFLIGFAIGISIGSLFTDLLQPYLPEVLKPMREEIEGQVTAEQLKKDKLLFTVSTSQGAILVTFNKNLAEIDLLIEKEDIITLGLHQYEPFVTNPQIIRVRKAQPHKEKVGERPTPGDSISPLEPGTGNLPDESEEEDSTEDSIAF